MGPKNHGCPVAGSGHLPRPGIRGKVTLKGRRTGLRRHEYRGLGGRGSQERGGLSRMPRLRRERGLSGRGASGEASRAQEGEAEERGANKPPRLIECGAERVEGSLRSVNGFKLEKGAKRSVSVFQKQEPASVRIFKPKGLKGLRRLRRRLNLVRVVGRERGCRVSSDPQTRGTKKRRLREASLTPKRETHAALGPPLAALHFRVGHGARNSRQIVERPAGGALPSVGGWWREAGPA